jgi:acetyltransferase-like isoleucine patch superfamily enzyme
MPGALGLGLRKLCYPWLLGRCGRNVVFGQNVVVRHPHKIRIGDNVVIDDNCLIDAKGEAESGVSIGSGVFIGRNTILSCKNGEIEVQDGANIGFNCEVFSASKVVIGAATLIAAYVYLVGGDHEFGDRSKAVLEQGRRSTGIRIGAGAWIGAGATVLDGVTIGDRAVVGASAVVRNDVPAGAMAVGIPARVVGDGAAG